jgi:hypothetical protein
MDLFVVPTISFRLLYGLLILRHDRRRLLWLETTTHPTAEWIARQLTEACGWDEGPDSDPPHAMRPTKPRVESASPHTPPQRPKPTRPMPRREQYTTEGPVDPQCSVKPAVPCKKSANAIAQIKPGSG